MSIIKSNVLSFFLIIMSILYQQPTTKVAYRDNKEVINLKWRDFDAESCPNVDRIPKRLFLFITHHQNLSSLKSHRKLAS